MAEPATVPGRRNANGEDLSRGKYFRKCTQRSYVSKSGRTYVEERELSANFRILFPFAIDRSRALVPWCSRDLREKTDWSLDGSISRGCGAVRVEERTVEGTNDVL